MGLTESKLKDLCDKKFDKLYEKHASEWKEITTNAYNSARDHICEGRVPRHDDVLKMLMPMLEPNETSAVTSKAANGGHPKTGQRN